MSRRKIWNNGQWVQVGGMNIDGFEVVEDSADAVDPTKLYLIADGVSPGELVTFRVNGVLGSGIWFGGNELWTPTLQATGGTVTDIMVAGTPYRVHTFTSSLDFEVLTTSLQVEYLVVGAGGAGGSYASARSGGGGGGGNVYSSTATLQTGVYPCTVGVGLDSIFGSVHTSLKGGDGSVGGANGGAGGANASYTGGAGGTIGGGGGAGGANGSAGSGNNGGNGALGVTSSITGSPVIYGSGGGGGGYANGGSYPGGTGGSGAGNGDGGSLGTDAQANRGGGGGGRDGWGTRAGTNVPRPGGSGIIVVRYPLA